MNKKVTIFAGRHSNKETEKLYLTAISFLGQDASPEDIANDEYGCADTVSSLLLKTYGQVIPYTISTTTLFQSLSNSREFVRIEQPQKGAIIISPTGYGNGKLPNGHVGVCGEGDKIMSNSSATGQLLQNYTISTWKQRYVDLGGYPIYYFKKI